MEQRGRKQYKKINTTESHFIEKINKINKLQEDSSRIKRRPESVKLNGKKC